MLKEVAMSDLRWYTIEEGIQRLREIGRLEWTHQVIPAHPLWERPGKRPFTMSVRIKSVRGAPASMKSSMIGLFCGSEIRVTLLPLNGGSLNAVKIGSWADTIDRLKTFYWSIVGLQCCVTLKSFKSPISSRSGTKGQAQPHHQLGHRNASTFIHFFISPPLASPGPSRELAFAWFVAHWHPHQRQHRTDWLESPEMPLVQQFQFWVCLWDGVSVYG